MELTRWRLLMCIKNNPGSTCLCTSWHRAAWVCWWGRAGLALCWAPVPPGRRPAWSPLNKTHIRAQSDEVTWTYQRGEATQACVSLRPCQFTRPSVTLSGMSVIHVGGLTTYCYNNTAASSSEQGCHENLIAIYLPSQIQNTSVPYTYSQIYCRLCNHTELRVALNHAIHSTKSVLHQKKKISI